MNVQFIFLRCHHVHVNRSIIKHMIPQCKHTQYYDYSIFRSIIGDIHMYIERFVYFIEGITLQHCYRSCLEKEFDFTPSMVSGNVV